jgi:HdeA/HdeB family
MKVTSKALFASTVALTVMASFGPAWAQNKSDRSVGQYTCKDIMRESGASREVSIGFIHGYLLGKAGAAKFNVDDLLKQTDAFIDRCLDNPTEKALDAMMKVKK